MPILEDINNKLFGKKDEEEDQGPRSYSQSGRGRTDDGTYDQSYDADEGYGGNTGSDRMPSKHPDTHYNPNEANTRIASSMDSTRTQNRNLNRMHGDDADASGDGFSWRSDR